MTIPTPETNLPPPPMPNIPQVNLPPATPAPNSAQGTQPDTSQADEAISNSPFAKMFPAGATPAQLRQFLNTFLQMMVFEFQQSNNAWQKGQQEMQKAETGEDDS